MAQMNSPSVEKTKQEVKSTLNGAVGNDTEKTINDLSARVTDLTERVRDMSANLADESANIVRNYPFHTAVGAAVVGFIAGSLILRRR